MRIRLDEQNLIDLCTGKEIDVDGAKLILADIGWDRVLMAIRSAMNENDNGMKHLKKFEQLNENAGSDENRIYEIATPAPVSMLVEELEELFGDDYRHLVTEYKSPDGLESLLMFNITPADIKKIQDNIGDVLIFEMTLTGRKEILPKG